MADFEPLEPALTILAAVGCGLMAGLFLVFSICVVRALSRLPTAAGAAAMQSINVTIRNPVFGALFFGTAAACFAVGLVSILSWPSGSSFALAGSVIYLTGGLVVTFAFNIPLNNRLERSDPTTDEGAGTWDDYVTSWTAWNHVRTVTSMAAATLLTIAASTRTSYTLQ